MSDSPEVVWHRQSVTTEDRCRLNGHRGCVLWFTGLSGSGKSTIANLVDRKLLQRGVHAYLLDGDNVRHGLNATPAMLREEFGPEAAERFGLGFSAEDRCENIRRIGAVAQLFCAAGLVTLTAFVSPYRTDRDRVRRMIESAGRKGDFIEIFVDVPIEVCEQRDPKGMYQKARAGEIRNFTGIDDPYEPPLEPELVLPTAREEPDRLADRVVDYLARAGMISPSS